MAIPKSVNILRWSKRKKLAFTSALFSLVAVILITIAYVTPHWIDFSEFPTTLLYPPSSNSTIDNRGYNITVFNYGLYFVCSLNQNNFNMVTTDRCFTIPLRNCTFLFEFPGLAFSQTLNHAADFFTFNDCSPIKDVRSLLITALIFCYFNFVVTSFNVGKKSPSLSLGISALSFMCAIISIICMAVWVNDQYNLANEQPGVKASLGYSFNLEVAGWVFSLASGVFSAVVIKYEKERGYAELGDEDDLTIGADPLLTSSNQADDVFGSLPPRDVGRAAASGGLKYD